MTLPQKVAWFNLSVALIAIAAYFILLPVLGPWGAMGAFGILGFSGLSVFFYYREKRKGGIIADERDQTISRQAYTIAKSIVWVVFFVTFAIAATYIGDGAISVRALSLAVWSLFCGYLVINSVATLVLYAKQ